MSDPAASNDLVREFNRSFPVAINLDPATYIYYPEELYHYTGAVGVEGILREKAMRATNFSFLNDPTEVQYGHNLVLQVLKQKQDRTRSHREKLLAAIKKSLRNQAVSEVYVCCFTECRDDLSQWRAYGTATGARYCLGFRADDLFKARVAKQECEFSRVEYDEQKQREPIETVLEKAIDFADRGLSEPDALKIAEAAARRLARLLPQMKSPAYDAEEEWRVIRWIPSAEVSELCFDATRGIIRPYVAFPLAAQAEQIPVVELIVLAPGRERPAVKSADMLLRRYGIRDLCSVPSKVPVAEYL